MFLSLDLRPECGNSAVLTDNLVDEYKGLLNIRRFSLNLMRGAVGNKKGAWPWSRDPLNANSSKMVKDMDFKFEKRVRKDSPDMTP